MIGRALTVTLLASILILSAAAVRAAGENSRTAGGAAPSRVLPRTQAYAGRVFVREHCPAAQHAIGYYRRSYTAARERMGLDGAVPRVWYQQCQVIKRRAVEWRNRSSAARRALATWTTYQHAWWEWMPRGWQNIGACETGYGKRPGNFRHNSGTYQGAFGFARSSWDTFVGSADPQAGPYPAEAYEATPRQQYEVALAIYRRFGLSGWGCRGAFYR